MTIPCHMPPERPHRETACNWRHKSFTLSEQRRDPVASHKVSGYGRTLTHVPKPSFLRLEIVDVLSAVETEWSLWDSEIILAERMKKMMFGGLTACGFAYGYRRFGGTLAPMCHCTWRHIPRGCYPISYLPSPTPEYHYSSTQPANIIQSNSVITTSV